MSESLERWGYARDRDAEAWHGSFLTKGEAMLDGLAHYCGEAFWVHSGTALRAIDIMPNADEIIEMMGERAYDKAGEAADDFPSVTREAREELDRLLREWADRHVESSLWVADGDVEFVPARAVKGGAS